jgi:hypothetical protein
MGLEQSALQVMDLAVVRWLDECTPAPRNNVVFAFDLDIDDRLISTRDSCIDVFAWGDTHSEKTIVALIWHSARRDRRDLFLCA